MHVSLAGRGEASGSHHAGNTTPHGRLHPLAASVRRQSWTHCPSGKHGPNSSPSCADRANIYLKTWNPKQRWLAQTLVQSVPCFCLGWLRMVFAQVISADFNFRPVGQIIQNMSPPSLPFSSTLSFSVLTPQVWCETGSHSWTKNGWLPTRSPAFHCQSFDACRSISASGRTRFLLACPHGLDCIASPTLLISEFVTH